MRKLIFLMAIVVSSGLFSCNDGENEPAPFQLPLLAIFESSSLGLGEEDQSLDVVVTFSRQTTEPGFFEVSIGSSSAEYGTDFTTDPAATNGVLTVDLPSGVSSAGFRLNKLQNPPFGQTREANFELTKVNGGEVGASNRLTVTFAEKSVSASGQIDAAVGGELQPNSVFIDLSRSRQTAVPRDRWDLGFYNGSDFRVIINSSTFAMARPLTKTDLNAVNSGDTVGFVREMNINAFNTEAAAWVDAPDGDLAKTAIAEVSSDPTQNTVYIINRGTRPDGSPIGWKKIRIIRAGNAYELQHADINSTTFETITISKDGSKNFSYISFDNGAVTVEPENEDWDICFTNWTELFPFGPPGTFVPYGFKDFIIQNRNGVEAALVEEDMLTYNNFTLADVAGLSLSADLNTIGSSWRSGGGPGSAPSIKTGQFYVIKDPEGNHYKVKFTRMYSLEGERGHPQLEYQILE